MKRPLNAQEQALRIQSRRRMIGAAVIMLCVVLLLPVILDHSMEPKLAVRGLIPPPSEAQQGKDQVVAPDVVARSDLPQPAADSVVAPSPPAPPIEPLTISDAAVIPAPAAAATAVVKPVASATVATASKAAFWVQVGVFSDRNKAQALVKKLADHEIHAIGEEAHYKDGARIRVRIGPLRNKAEALAMTHQLDQLNLKYMVVSP
jgi:DedD protein